MRMVEREHTAQADLMLRGTISVTSVLRRAVRLSPSQHSRLWALAAVMLPALQPAAHSGTARPLDHKKDVMCA